MPPGDLHALQKRASLPGASVVSRTFALTIRVLPGPLRDPVTVAYLLCRLADLLEDAIALRPGRADRGAGVAGPGDRDRGVFTGRSGGRPGAGRIAAAAR